MSINAAINHLSVELPTIDPAANQEVSQDLAYLLGSAPLGEINPAMEAAIATARFLAGSMPKGAYLNRLQRQIEASHKSDDPS